MSLSMGKPPRPPTFGMNSCVMQMHKVSNYRFVERRAKFDVDQVEWQCAAYEFETGNF